jgi:uncharacterized protein YodC (DUF2158 family)
MTDEKIFFQPGDLVILRHKDVKNKPVMYVVEKVSKQYKAGDEISNVFTGMRCRWFDDNKVLREAIFSTKDLEFYK